MTDKEPDICATVILETLKKKLPEYSPRLRQAAKYILENPEDLAILTMRALAAKAGVAPSTMIRLSQTLGFSSFDLLRGSFGDVLRARGGFTQRAKAIHDFSNSREDQWSKVAVDIANAGITNIEKSFLAEDVAELKRAADKITNARRAYITGGGTVRHIASYFLSAAKISCDNLVLVDLAGGSELGDLYGMTDDDTLLCLGFEPYLQSNVDTTDVAHQRKAQIIAVTDSRASPVARHADVVLLASVKGPLFLPSQIAVLTILEALLGLVAAKDTRRTVARIKEIEEFRRNSGIYWRDQN